MTQVVYEGNGWAYFSQKGGFTFLKYIFLLNFENCGWLEWGCVWA